MCHNANVGCLRSGTMCLSSDSNVAIYLMCGKPTCTRNTPSLSSPCMTTWLPSVKNRGYVLAADRSMGITAVRSSRYHTPSSNYDYFHQVTHSHFNFHRTNLFKKLCMVVLTNLRYNTKENFSAGASEKRLHR